MKGVNTMKSMRKHLSLLLALTMLLSALPAMAGGEPDGIHTPDIVRWDKDELVVGHPTVTKGDFFTEMFGNDTADIDVRAMLHGYNIIHWDENQGVYLFDESVVKDVLNVTDKLGNKTYYIELYDDLYYSDGSPITAWDYAFSLLLMMSPEVEQIGGKIYRAEHILGYNEYLTGALPYLTGVGVLDDYQLAITLDHEFLPYFFELGLLLCAPYPIKVIAPGCKVMSDGLEDYGNGYGYGIYIANEDPSVAEPVYTADLLRQTILDPETGYNSHPSVVSGPYTLLGYDGVTLHFERNPYFKGVPLKTYKSGDEPNGIWVIEGTTLMDGNSEAQPALIKPSIEKVAFTLANNDTMIKDIQSGKLDLVNKVVYGPTIDEGRAAGLKNKDYPRIGLSFLTFTYEWPTVHDMQVRQAIAWCMDRDALTREYCKGYGVRVDGYYGIEQWEYLLATHKMEYPINFEDEEDKEDDRHYQGVHLHTETDYEKAARLWDGLSLDNLTVYHVDTAKANVLLNDAGWTLNEKGETYTPGSGDIRSKMVDGELVSLDLSMMYPEGNHIVDHLQEYFIDNLNACGIRLTLVPTPMQDLFYSYYRETERTTDMIYLATDFHVIVDPSITYSTDTTANHQIWNNTYSDDERLYYLAVEMRKTDPRDVFDYVSKWVAFQERYNEVLPTIPIYSNVYYDFWVPNLSNYIITGHVTWSQAILESSFSGRSVPTATPAP